MTTHSLSTAVRRPPFYAAAILALAAAIEQTTDLPKAWWVYTIKIVASSYIMLNTAKGRAEDAPDPTDQAGA